MDPYTMKTLGKFNKDTTLYAIWEQTAYRLSFNANGGYVYEEARYVSKDKPIGMLPEATPNDMRQKFSRWTWDQNPTAGSATVS